MAYIFSDDQNGDAANNVATNIFQANAGGTSNNPPDQNGSPKPVGSGDQSAAVSTGGNGQGGGQQQQQQASNSASTSKEAIRRNEGKTQSPINIGNLQGEMTTAKAAVQKEADNYVGNQKSSGQDYDDASINKALSGDDDTTLKGLGTRLHSATPQYAAFNPTTDTDFSKKLNDLSDTNMRNYFKNANGPATTQGDAAFDTMLLNKNNQFKQDRSQAMQQAQGLTADINNIKADTDTKGQAALSKSWDDAGTHIKSSVQAILDGIKNPAEKQAAEAEALRQKWQNMSPAERAQNAQGYAAWNNGIVDQVGTNQAQRDFLRGFSSGGGMTQAMDPNSLSFSRGLVNDPTNFVDVSGTPVNVNNFLSPEQAAELNRGYDLIDGRHTSYAAGGPAAAPYSLNTGAAKAHLYKILGDQTAAEQSVAQYQKEQSDAEAERQAAIARGDQEAADRAKARQEENRKRNAITAAGQDALPASGGATGKAVGEAQKWLPSVSGKIICSEYHRLGWLPDAILKADLEYQRLHTPIETIKNYLAWAPYIVAAVKGNRLARVLYWPIARTWAYQMAYELGVVKKAPLLGKMSVRGLVAISNALGSTIRSYRKRQRCLEVL